MSHISNCVCVCGGGVSIFPGKNLAAVEGYARLHAELCKQLSISFMAPQVTQAFDLGFFVMTITDIKASSVHSSSPHTLVFNNILNKTLNACFFTILPKICKYETLPL